MTRRNISDFVVGLAGICLAILLFMSLGTTIMAVLRFLGVRL